jgi:hypothetical protein
MFFKKKSLKTYFFHKKITLPIINYNNNEYLFTHANRNDLDILQKEFDNQITITKVPHKKYNFIYSLQFKNELIVIVDEAHLTSDINTIEIMLDIIKNNNWGRNIIELKHDNIIEVNFTR